MNDLEHDNFHVLRDYFRGAVSGDYYDGMHHMLLLELSTGLLSTSTEASRSVAQPGFELLDVVHGYDPGGELCGPDDEIEYFGFADWCDDVLSRSSIPLTA